MATENHSDTCGIRTGRDVIVQRDLVNIINSHPVSVTPAGPSSRKPAFRYNLPLGTPHFKGRQDVFDKITNHSGHFLTISSMVQKILRLLFSFFWRTTAQSSYGWNQIVAIVGMGGIGKSELACQFANKYRQNYPNAAWINAETSQSALNSFLGLAKSLGIVSDRREEADLDLVKDVYHHISDNYPERVLLIFDNAIQLKSCQKNFGIMDFLPSGDLAEQRFPFVIITTQTPDWHQGIQTFQLDVLKEEESVDFFRSTFKVTSSDCDKAFKKLHSVLKGYPLAMTLAASNIDFNHQKDRSSRLLKQIERYIEKFDKEDSQIPDENISKNWPSTYNQTLSTVWQLSFQRLRAEPHGANAIKLLQAVSFFHLPATTEDLMRVFIECPFCPDTPEWMQYDYLEEAIRLLQRFYAADSTIIWEREVDSTKYFCCELEVHRLVQYVVRLKMDCSAVLEDILRFFSFCNINSRIRRINLSAVEETFERCRLSTRAVAFIGILASKGNQTARRIVETRSARLDPAATIWRMCNSNPNIEVLRSFISLGASEKALIGQRLYAGMAINVFVSILLRVPEDGTSAAGITDLQAFQDLVWESFSTGCSFDDVCTQPSLCINIIRQAVISGTVTLGKKIMERLTKAEQPESRVAEIREKLRKYSEFVKLHHPEFHFAMGLKEAIMDHCGIVSKFEESEQELSGSNQQEFKQYILSLLEKIRSANWKALLDSIFSDLSTFRENDLETGDESLHVRLNEAYFEFHKALQVTEDNYEDAMVDLWSRLKVALTSWHQSNSDIGTRLLDGFKNRTKEMSKMSSDEIQSLTLRNFSKLLSMANQSETFQMFLYTYSWSPVEDTRACVALIQEILEEMPIVLEKFGYSCTRN